MNVKRIFIVSGTGIKEVSRGVYSYDLTTLMLGLSLGLPNHTKTTIKLDDGFYADGIVFYVAPDCEARRNFLACCRILNRTPEGCVYCVIDSTNGYLVSLHQSLAGALGQIHGKGSVAASLHITLHQVEK